MKPDKQLRLYSALKAISQYQSPRSLEREAEKSYGLTYEEALEMAYENIVNTAKHALKGIKPPTV